VWTYIARRLLVMIPTLFGVTVVSFCIMQMAPGDPQLAQLGTTGATGQSSQTREAYLIQKRDLKLDKPLVLNFNYFHDYAEKVRVAAHYLARSRAEVAAELPGLADRPDEPENLRRLAFLRSLDITDFQRRLDDPAQHDRLALAILGYVQIFCEDAGVHGVPPAIAILRDDSAALREKIGAIRGLGSMVVDPFVYTYSRDPSPRQTAEIQAVWRLWWERVGPTFPEIDSDRRAYFQKKFDRLAESTSRYEQGEMLADFERDDMPLFVEKLLGDSTLQEKVVAAAALRLYVNQPLKLDVPIDAGPKLVQEVSDNWFAQYELNRERYEPGWFEKVWCVVADTQYAHMVWRLVTFQFGRSALKTREPVGDKILAAVLVSAPLMVMADLMIYLVAVPLGIVCAVNRGKWIDRLISLKLFLLYSIPPFVAGMLFLLFLCYGSYLKWFPMMGLHEEGAEQFGYLLKCLWHASDPVQFFRAVAQLGRYLLDYLWHAFLPVTCLSLFSLAGLAMYSRTSMLDVVGQDYIRTARAKGLSEGKVIFKHGLRNAMIPIITLFSGFLPAMLGGSVLIEVIFGIPGMGRLSWLSIEQKDFPTLMALIYIDAIVVMLSILMTDLLYVVVDPRISFEAQGASA
jgi:ABC-type dipeptide/oligopeptide/nickel transport system permease component